MRDNRETQKRRRPSDLNKSGRKSRKFIRFDENATHIECDRDGSIHE